MSKYDKAMMDTAKVFANQSYCNRRKVGAVLAKNGRILATGYNGTIAGMSNDCECEDGTTNEFTLHAEQNLITFCAKNGISTNETTMYITLSPCKTCAKLIAQSGITEVIVDEIYRDVEGLDFLKKCNINVRKITND